MISLENALLRDIKNLSNESEGYDVMLQVGQHPEIDSFRAHFLILHARSSYFRSILSSNKWGEESNECVLLLPSISPCVFKVLLGYIYSGSINMSDTTIKSIYLDLLTAADELELSELTENMQEYLISHEIDWIRNNFFNLLQTTAKSKAFTKLENFCQEIFRTNQASILTSDGFLELEADFLVSLFKRDDIVLDEILIWESVIRWGMAQIKLNTDVSQWTNRDFIRLKKAVKNLIPHIRFFNISGIDHRTRVRPYKKILPKALKEEIKDYFFAQVPPKKFCKLPLRAIKNESNGSIANNSDHETFTSIDSILMDTNGFCQVFKIEKNIYKNDNVKKAKIVYDSDDTVESDSDYLDVDKL
ncbi:34786_t:CDS:2 [Racocetra persica]|uniref:34786_t:CDS:1 n=1 Tax=Racocetra persica TaxID=160502 RepID=A0ACA9KTG1_9GLOM|nr:34786_t:CDS:2 [Racocetra persica]